MDKELQLNESGLVLSEAFYREAGHPAIERGCPQALPYLAAGLVGEGSECFGFDDRISMDHDYGPSFCVWLTEEDEKRFGDQLRQVLAELPAEFHGVSYGLRLEQARGRRGLDTVPDFYRRFLGKRYEPASLTDWFLLPETHLAAATNGRVFEDNSGEFSRIRQKLLNFYPEDVRRHRMACRAVTMAHEGQCNYSRMLRRGDTVAAFMALGRFMEAACSMIHLLNRRYTPYYKWAWKSLATLPKLREAADALQRISQCGPDLSHWPAADWEKYGRRLNLHDPAVAGIEEVCALVSAELLRQDLAEGGDYLEEQARDLQRGIEDDLIRRQPIKVN